MVERIFNDEQNKIKQRAYAQYLSNLPFATRSRMIRKMKGQQAQDNMRELVAEAIAIRVIDWEETVKKAFMKKLKHQCWYEYQRVLKQMLKIEGNEPC